MQNSRNKMIANIKRKTYTIDAKDKILGRLSVKIAALLSGKQKSDFVPYKDMGDFVVVKNIAQIKFTGRKMKQKIYYHHSGYPGGFKKNPLEELFKKNPGQVLRKTVLGMLPKNKLRPRRIKRLMFK